MNPDEGDNSALIVTLDSLPHGSLSISQIENIGEAESIEIVAPLVIDTATDRVTHFDLVHNDTHHYVGWNPTAEQWEQLLVVDETAEELTVVSAIGVTDKTGASLINLSKGDQPDIPDIVKTTWEHIEATYPQTADLYNVMEDALKDLQDDGE